MGNFASFVLIGGLATLLQYAPLLAGVNGAMVPCDQTNIATGPLRSGSSVRPMSDRCSPAIS